MLLSPTHTAARLNVWRRICSLRAPCRPSIPKGKVASYGQVAALSGAPRNARQVGALLRDGLCSGGSPWHRVILAARACRQQAETFSVSGSWRRVVFTPAGCVVQTAWWARVAPFYA